MTDTILKQDHDGHWYRIPTNREWRFNELMDLTEGMDYMDAAFEYDDFITEFSDYMTGGDPNNF